VRQPESKTHILGEGRDIQSSTQNSRGSSRCTDNPQDRWTLDEAELAAFQLSLGEVGKRTHAGVVPTGACDPDELQRRLAATRPKWRKV
jgi:hypothetical protein